MGIYNEYTITVKPHIRLFYAFAGCLTTTCVFVFLASNHDVTQKVVISLFLGVISIILFWCATTNDHIRFDEYGISVNNEKKIIAWNDIKYVYILKDKNSKSNSKYLCIDYQNGDHEIISIDNLNINSPKLREYVKECSGKDIGSTICKHRDELLEKQTSLSEEEKEDEYKRLDSILTTLSTLNEKIQRILMRSVILSFFTNFVIIFLILKFRKDIVDITFHFFMPMITILSVAFGYMAFLVKTAYNLPQIKALGKNELSTYEKLLDIKYGNSIMKLAKTLAVPSLIYVLYTLICLMA